MHSPLVLRSTYDCAIRAHNAQLLELAGKIIELSNQVATLTAALERSQAATLAAAAELSQEAARKQMAIERARLQNSSFWP